LNIGGYCIFIDFWNLPESSNAQMRRRFILEVGAKKL